MNILLLLTSLLFCDELTEARQRYEESLRKIESSTSLDKVIESEEKEPTPIPESRSRIEVDWRTQPAQSSSPDSVVLVSGPTAPRVSSERISSSLLELLTGRSQLTKRLPKAFHCESFRMACTQFRRCFLTNRNLCRAWRLLR